MARRGAIPPDVKLILDYHYLRAEKQSKVQCCPCKKMKLGGARRDLESLFHPYFLVVADENG